MVELFPLIILLYISYTDLKNRIVDEIPAFLLLIFSIIKFLLSVETKYQVFSFLAISSIFYLSFLRGYIADGDLVLLISLSLLFPDFFKFFSILTISFSLFSNLYFKLPTMIFPILSIYLFKKNVFLSIILSAIGLLPISFKKTEIRVVKKNELIPGDILAEDIKVNGKILFKNPGRSLTKWEIERIKNLPVEKVKIKWGFPMVPSLLIFYILALVL